MHDSSHPFELGAIKTTFLITEAPDNPNDPQWLSCECLPDPIALPDEIARLRTQVESEQQQALAAGRDHFWNGGTYGLAEIARLRSPGEERPQLRLTLHPSDYFRYLAVLRGLDRTFAEVGGVSTTLRERYLPNVNAERVVPHMSQSLAVAAAIVTSDDYVIVTRRHARLAAAPGFYSSSVNEALTRDPADPNRDRPSPAAAVVRGAREELGLTIAESDIRYLSFGVDTRFYQWGIACMAETNLTAAAVRSSLSLGTKDGTYEHDAVFFVPLEIAPLLNFIAGRGPWASGGVSALVHTLAARHGREAVFRHQPDGGLSPA